MTSLQGENYEQTTNNIDAFTITASVVFAETKIPVQHIKIKDGDTIDVKIEKTLFR